MFVVAKVWWSPTSVTCYPQLDGHKHIIWCDFKGNTIQDICNKVSDVTTNKGLVIRTDIGLHWYDQAF